MKYLMEQKLVVSVGLGLWVISDPLTQIMDTIDKDILSTVNKYNPKSLHVPHMLSPMNALRSEYLNSFQKQAIICHSMHDPIWEMSNPCFDVNHSSGMNSSTVCYHFFGALAGATIKENTCMTALGRCTRYEEGDLDDLSRLTNFTMRELMFIGSKNYCEATLNKALTDTVSLFDRKYKLSFHIQTASDPFFGENSETKAKVQLLSRAKLELTAEIPFKNETISLASFNNHGNVFYRRFNISSDMPDYCSGCVGWGYERILFAVISQHGTDFNSDYFKCLRNQNHD